MYDDKLQSRSNVDKNLITDIMESIFEHSPDEKPHSEETSNLAKKIAEAMGLSKLDVNKVALAGKYHDIGKVIFNAEMMRIGIPQGQETINRFKQHAVVGYRILSLFDQTMNFADDVLAHHERWDGSGYPYGLKAEEIPIGARIIAVAEAAQRKKNDYADCEDRVQRVLEEIREESGKKYDPDVVEAYLQIISDMDEKGA